MLPHCSLDMKRIIRYVFEKLKNHNKYFNLVNKYTSFSKENNSEYVEKTRNKYIMYYI